MSAENKLPAIRFERFSGDWHMHSLQSFADILDGDRGANYPNGDDLQATGHTLFLSASNITSKGFKLGLSQYISEDKSNSMGNGKLVLDDIVLTSRGSVGHIGWYNEKINQQVPFARINSGMLIIRSKKQVTPSVVAQFLKSPAGKKKIDLISFGSAQPQLTKMSVSAYTVNLPKEKEEQTKIGQYFQQLDTLIAQHQKKHEKLLNLKKALLDKLFPKQGSTEPALRFKGFSGAWEEKALGDVMTFINGRAYSQDELLTNGKYPVLRVGNFYTNSSWYYSNMELGEKYYAKNGDLLYTWSASFGPHVWGGGKVIYHYHIWKLLLSHNIERSFSLHVLNKDRDNILEGSNGSTMIHITKEGMEKKSIVLPELNEQRKLGELLDSLDTLITQHQSQLKKLGNIKQACLEKMFV